VRCEADVVGAVEPMMVARTVRMPKLISSANRSLRDAVPRWHEISRAPESASN